MVRNLARGVREIVDNNRCPPGYTSELMMSLRGEKELGIERKVLW